MKSFWVSGAQWKKPGWDQLNKCIMCISSYLARLSTTNRKEKASFDEQFVLY